MITPKVHSTRPDGYTKCGLANQPFIIEGTHIIIGKTVYTAPTCERCKSWNKIEKPEAVHAKKR